MFRLRLAVLVLLERLGASEIGMEERPSSC
jgi:hypothetical protein